MEDKLKKKVEEERADFDLYEIDSNALWEGIEADLNKQKKINPWKIYSRIAAAVVAVIGISWIAYSYSFGTYSDGFALHELSPEMVAEKIQMIKASTGALDPDVLDNLAMLDSAYTELKIDLKDNAANEEVIDAMITNYRIKLQLLEQILMEIKEHDHEFNNEISI